MPSGLHPPHSSAHDTPAVPGDERTRAQSSILVTVGSDGPFDRLIRAVDAWAGAHGRRDVFAQIGASKYRPENIAFESFLEPPDFAQRFAGASVIVAHAGMGTILSALRYGKPILVMPRRASLGEQRNEHQLATARRLSQLGKITVAFDEKELVDYLDNIDRLDVRDRTGAYASKSLTDALRDFIQSGP